MKKNRISAVLVWILTITLLAGIIVPLAGAADPLATPDVTYNFDYRSLIFEPVQGATSYTVWVFDDPALAAASTDGTGAVAKSAGITESTQHSKSFGGTTAVRPPDTRGDAVGGKLLIDVRLLMYDDVEPNEVTRTLPTSYIPGGIADSYFAGGCDGSCNGVPHGIAEAGEEFAGRPRPHTDNSPCVKLEEPFVPGDKTNLIPGQYWFRVQAIAGATKSGLSALPDPPLMPASPPTGVTPTRTAPPNPFSIAMGPTEAKELIEDNLTKITNASDNSVRFIDLRPPAEIGDEGRIRYAEQALPTLIGNDPTKTAAQNREEALKFFKVNEGEQNSVKIIMY